MSQPKRLYRNKQNGKIAGVCSGLADYFNVDVVLVRLAAVATIFISGAGIPVYLLAWLIVPARK